MNVKLHNCFWRKKIILGIKPFHMFNIMKWFSMFWVAEIHVWCWKPFAHDKYLKCITKCTSSTEETPGVIIQNYQVLFFYMAFIHPATNPNKWFDFFQLNIVLHKYCNNFDHIKTILQKFKRNTLLISHLQLTTLDLLRSICKIINIQTISWLNDY